MKKVVKRFKVCDNAQGSHMWVMSMRQQCQRLKARKKSLKISKRQSEIVYRRRRDNTMAKRKSTRGQTTIDKTYI
jgi:hypothetical protein